MATVSIDFAGLQAKLSRQYKRIAADKLEERVKRTLEQTIKVVEGWVSNIKQNMSKLSISRGYDAKHRLNTHNQYKYNRLWPMQSSGHLMNSIKAKAKAIRVGDTRYKIIVTKNVGPTRNKRGFDYSKWLNEEHMYLSGYKERAYDMLDSKIRELVRVR